MTGNGAVYVFVIPPSVEVPNPISCIQEPKPRKTMKPRIKSTVRLPATNSIPKNQPSMRSTTELSPPSGKYDQKLYHLPNSCEPVVIGVIMIHCIKNKMGLKVMDHQPSQGKMSIKVENFDSLVDVVSTMRIRQTISTTKSMVLRYLQRLLKRRDGLRGPFKIEDGMIYQVKSERYEKMRKAIA